MKDINVIKLHLNILAQVPYGTWLRCVLHLPEQGVEWHLVAGLGVEPSLEDYASRFSYYYECRTISSST